MNEIELLGNAIQFGPSIFRTVWMVKKNQKVISRDIKKSAINLTKILFYEPFIVYDCIKLIRQKIDKRTKIVKSKGSSFY